MNHYYRITLKVNLGRPPSTFLPSRKFIGEPIQERRDVVPSINTARVLGGGRGIVGPVEVNGSSHLTCVEGTSTGSSSI